MRNILYKQARREAFLNALEKTALLETLKSMGTTLAAPFKAVAPAAHAVTGAIANPATVHATENAAQTAAQTPAGHGFMNAIKGYGREMADLTKDFVQNPVAVSKESLRDIWNPPGAGWKGKAFSRLFGVGMPLAIGAGMLMNPGETSFQDLGSFAGMQAGMLATPLGRASIPASLLMSYGGDYIGSKAGKFLDQITGHGQAVERRRQAHALQ